jgi:quinolinate synthase
MIMDSRAYADEIIRLKKERRAVILAHNYQRPEIQAIADFTGDSLGLAQQAAETDADTIVFCGVNFMAETAHILSPQKTVLTPEPRAGCPLADMVTVEGLEELKSRHPGVPVVCYVNSSAAVKAASDVCCTSSNAVEIVSRLDSDRAIFVPDENLGRYVAQKTNKDLILWPGHCPTHRRIRRESVAALKERYPDARFVAHPECDADVLELADHICSTSGMYKFASTSPAERIIVGSESGMLYRLEKDNPQKEFFMPASNIVCPNMKMITLKKLYSCLLNNETAVTLPPSIRQKAEEATARMMAVLA